MTRAALQIDLDTSSVQRMFGVLRQSSRTAAAAITADMRATERERQRIDRKAESDARRAAAVAARAMKDAERAKTRATEQEAKARERIAARETREFQKSVATRAREFASSERRVTSLADQYARQRERTAKREADTKVREAQRAAREAEREAARALRASEQQRRRVGGVASRVTSAVGSAASGYASAIHGDVQSERQRAATSEHMLNSALFQIGGVDPRMAAQIRAQVMGFARDRGISSESIISGIAASQTQFSSLTPQGNERTVGDAVRRHLELAQFAASTYQDPGEVMRVAGMLNQQNVRGADQTSMLRALTGMAQAGAIELSNVSADALGPLMGNIARTTNPNMSAAERSTAVQRATAESFAVAQVAKSGGMEAPDALNALAKTRQTLVSPDRAQSLYTRLHRARRDDLAAELLQTDTHGNHTFRDADPVQFMSRLLAGFHGDAAAALNVTSGVGRGLGQRVFSDTQARLFSALASQTQGGQSLEGTVTGLAQRGAELTPARIAEGEALRQSEQGTELTRADEAHAAALTDNTNAVVRLSNEFATWSTAHPFMSQGLETGTGLVAPLATNAAGRIAGRVLGGAAPSLALGSVAPTTAGVTGLAGLAPLALPLAAGATFTALADGAMEAGQSWTAREQAIDANRRQQGAAFGATQNIGSLPRISLDDNSVDRIARALASAQITATVSPVDAAQAAASAATARGR